MLFAVGVSCAHLSIAQIVSENEKIDPRLVEITKIVKTRALNPQNFKSEKESLTRDEKYLVLVDRMETSSYSHEAETILRSAQDFRKAYKNDSSVGLVQIDLLYRTYSSLLLSEASNSDLQNSISEYTTTGNWFERYMALSLSAHVHGAARERQAALQKAQLALSLIPTKPNPENEVYVNYAKARIVSLIANLHNLQGNNELALATSLEYLRITTANPDLKAEVDLINNLIYSYSISRNHSAQLYLSEQLLEIEKIQSSSVPGLSEMRISDVMNSSGQFGQAQDFANRSLAVATHPTIKRRSQVNKAIALAGLGRFDESKEIAILAGVDLSTNHMLQSETRSGDLFLAFLLAQGEDPKYATQLFNRQLDVKAQEFLANNSRDTTAMLAELENSRERQAEREAARERESRLQAMTISRQRNLNRTLTALSLFLGLAALAALLFTRFRGQVMRRLEIKTKEAASAEKLKTEFLGMISHELRTPLNGIIGISDYLANYHQDEDIREKTGIVLKSGNELLDVVESLTDMARLDAGQLELIPHEANIGDSLALVPERWSEKAEAKGIKFTHFIDPSIGACTIDEVRLLQCINILLANAISFTDSGRVHLHITASKTDPVALNVVVADTGQGMTELVQSRLFKPFMQADTSRKRNHMGTGLSLAIAYALVDMMGGELTCVSREGRGSEFTFKIPLQVVDSQALAAGPTIIGHTLKGSEEEVPSGDVDQAENHIDAPQESITPAAPASAELLEPPVLDQTDGPDIDYVDLMQPSTGGRPGLHAPLEENTLNQDVAPQRILIVDDIVSNRDVLTMMLESKGHLCSQASDGFTALSALNRQRFDLVLLDIHMAPMDGLEALRRLRSSGNKNANIPVIALTADNAPKTNVECMDAGANLFLTKPVRRGKLLESIEQLYHTDSARILSHKAS